MMLPRRLALVVCILMMALVGTTQAGAQKPTAASPDDLQKLAAERLSKLADQIERQAATASSAFKPLAYTYPGGEHAAILNRTVSDLRNSPSPAVKNVFASHEVRGFAEVIERDPDTAVKNPAIVTGMLTKASEEIGGYKAQAGYVRALAASVAAGPAKQSLRALDQIVVTPDLEMVLAANGIQKDQLAYFATGSGRVVGRGARPSIDYPAVASLMQDYGDGAMSTFCTGTLIAPNIILSAAHCFCEFDDEQMFLDARACRQATFRRTDGSRIGALASRYRRAYFQHVGTREISKIVIPDEYAFPTADLAIVVLAASVDGIAPLPLGEMSALPANATARVVGFGRHSRLDSSGRPIGVRAEQQDAGLKFISKTRLGACTAPDAARKLICWVYDQRTAETAGNTCSGDSGAPLVVLIENRETLVGVVSGGTNKDCGPGDYAFNVDVRGFSGWIKATLNANPAPRSAASGISSLKPLENEYRYYVLWKDWQRFDLAQPLWDKEFIVPAGVGALHVGINSHFLNSSAALVIEVFAPNGTRVCNVSTDGNALMCNRINTPAAGKWRLRTKGPAGLEFQAVATIYTKSP